MADRYLACLGCGYIMTWLQHSSLRFAMPCPDCGKPAEFGPGVYVEDYKGLTLKEAMNRRMERRHNSSSTRAEK